MFQLTPFTFAALAVFIMFASVSLPDTIIVASTQDGENYENLEALIETSRGPIIMEFFPKDAPRHVEYFVKQARAGAYDGTTFHRAVQYALIQGGDPLSKNARNRAQYGTGGLNAGLPDEVNKNKHITGAVSSVLQLSGAGSSAVKAGSSGQQFFIILNVGTAQKTLDAQFTVFGVIVEGLDTVSEISALPAVKENITDRVEIKKVTIREKTPTLEQMKSMQATVETSKGNLKLQFTPEAAPNATRAFIRYARQGIYDGTAFFRISQKYFIDAGYTDTWAPDSPNRKRFFAYWPKPYETNDTKQLRGTLSMRQGTDGTTGVQFFIISKDNPALDGKHAPVAKITEGLDVLDKIAEAEVEADKPKERIEIKKITVQ
jgi:peptidyl-prolyl cis-trans isomerase B (cyclophilin B)